MPVPEEDANKAQKIQELYDREGPALFRYATMILASHAAAEDVVQEVFAGLLRNLHRLQSPDRYLWVSVRNRCYSVLRQRRDLPDTLRRSVTLEPTAGSEQDVTTRMALEKALATLPPEQREVVHLKVFEGRTFEDIAALLESPVGTVSSRYRYALEKLRNILDAE